MLTREQKEKIVGELNEKIAKAKAIVLLDFTGLNVGQISDLRKQLKNNDAELKVAKKRLVNIALKNNKIEMPLEENKSQLALAFGYQDEVSAVKVAHKLSDNDKAFKVLAGIVSGDYLDEAAIKALAKLPSKEELLAKLVGTISAPISGFVNVLQGNTRGLVRVLNQIKK